MMTVVPPVVQPSLGQMALIVGVAVQRKPGGEPEKSMPATTQGDKKHR